jgi:hypothetical protein
MGMLSVLRASVYMCVGKVGTTLPGDSDFCCPVLVRHWLSLLLFPYCS